ncbi:unnamed protein product [Malus baccata var. baccata]
MWVVVMIFSLTRKISLPSGIQQQQQQQQQSLFPLSGVGYMNPRTPLHTAGDIFVWIPKGNAIFMKFDVYLMNTNAMGKENSERITKVREKKQDFQTFELLVPLFKNM